MVTGELAEGDVGKRAALLATGGVVLSACTATAPTGAVPITPPTIYRAWFAATESCSALKVDFAKLRFSIVPGKADGFPCPTGTCVGRWEPPYDIYIAETYAMHEMVVRHEMLHALIGKAGHPDPPFERGCGLTWASWRGSTTETAAPRREVTATGID